MTLSSPSTDEQEAAGNSEHRAWLRLLLSIKDALEKISAELRAAQVLPPAPRAKQRSPCKPPNSHRAALTQHKNPKTSEQRRRSGPL
jgi:hypothetical protein